MDEEKKKTIKWVSGLEREKIKKREKEIERELRIEDRENLEVDRKDQYLGGKRTKPDTQWRRQEKGQYKKRERERERESMQVEIYIQLEGGCVRILKGKLKGVDRP